MYGTIGHIGAGTASALCQSINRVTDSLNAMIVIIEGAPIATVKMQTYIDDFLASVILELEYDVLVSPYLLREYCTIVFPTMNNKSLVVLKHYYPSWFG